jgi:hypothetical protein
MMRDPVSLRNIPPEAMRYAAGLSASTGLSMSDVFRLALVSGCLVELTRIAPDEAGRYGGVDGLVLAKALRRLLASAIDLLLEHGQHPYQGAFRGAVEPHASLHSSQVLSASEPTDEQGATFDRALGEDLELLGIGFGLSEASA